MTLFTIAKMIDYSLIQPLGLYYHVVILSCNLRVLYSVFNRTQPYISILSTILDQQMLPPWGKIGKHPAAFESQMSRPIAYMNDRLIRSRQKIKKYILIVQKMGWGLRPLHGTIRFKCL